MFKAKDVRDILDKAEVFCIDHRDEAANYHFMSIYCKGFLDYNTVVLGFDCKTGCLESAQFFYEPPMDSFSGEYNFNMPKEDIHYNGFDKPIPLIILIDILGQLQKQVYNEVDGSFIKLEYIFSINDKGTPTMSDYVFGTGFVKITAPEI